MKNTQNIEVVDVKDEFFREYDSRVITFVPQQREGHKFVYNNEIHNVAKLFKSKGIKYNIPGDQNLKYLEQRSADFFLPAIYIGLQMYMENKDLIDVAIDLFKEYISKIGSGAKGSDDPSVQLTIYTEKTKTKQIMKMSYKGPVSGLGELKASVKEVTSD